jgi:membrane-associated phospholipid phosphatase
MFATKISRRACGALLLLGSTLTSPGTGWAQPRHSAEPHPESRQPWVLASASQFRLPPPPDAAATRMELGQLHGMSASRDAETLERVAWWNAAAPSYRWNEIALAEMLRAGVPVNLASRHLALLHTALDDATAAAWDSKRAHNRARPGAADPTFRPAIAVPASPSYPDEHAVAAGVAAAVLAEIFPRRAEDFARLAEEAGHLRLVAGVAHPSDVVVGAALGQQVAAAALERARRDGTAQRWTGTVPAGPGQWSGTNPALPQAAGWTPWLLSSAADVRPPPPPAADSPARAAELAQLRAIERTPLSNARALFWEAAAGGLRSHEYWNTHLGRLLFEHGAAADAPRAARAYALLNAAMFDAGVACWDAKYAYWTARPAQLDVGFRPVFAAPNHPGYPSAHTCFSTAAAGVLGHLFPRDASVMAALAREAGESRLWAGIHTASDVTAGEAIGRAVVDRAVARARDGGAEGRAP